MNEWLEVSTVEGQRLTGGTAFVRERERATHGLVYEIRYPAGVGSPVHSHDHDSVIYVLQGRLTGVVDGPPPNSALATPPSTPAESSTR
ncbi:hypothetical protein ACQPXB_46675 [Amycolatopsis sp. CA-161197]|uniref:hypothetical protein n=1 Tax=Amycolatopsis sp. CA-161197 TaxID=3239922 RepID=UPI003D8D7C60